MTETTLDPAAVEKLKNDNPHEWRGGLRDFHAESGAVGSPTAMLRAIDRLSRGDEATAAYWAAYAAAGVVRVRRYATPWAGGRFYLSRKLDGRNEADGFRTVDEAKRWAAENGRHIEEES